MWKYLLTVGDCLSQLVNAVVFFSGDPNESLSARAYRCRENRFWWLMQVAIDTLFSLFGYDEHCISSYFADRDRALALINSELP